MFKLPLFDRLELHENKRQTVETDCSETGKLQLNNEEEESQLMSAQSKPSCGTCICVESEQLFFHFQLHSYVSRSIHR